MQKQKVYYMNSHSYEQSFICCLFSIVKKYMYCY